MKIIVAAVIATFFVVQVRFSAPVVAVERM